MKIFPLRMPATIVGFFVATILVATPLLFNIDIIQVKIRFLDVLVRDRLDDIIVGVFLIFVGIAIDRAMEFRRSAKILQESKNHLEEAVLQFVETMAQALDARDKYTAGHSDRVSINSTVIAEAMRLAPEEIEIIRIGARLHDIGKIGIPDTVLQKPGKLTEDEYALIRLHPQIGKKILEKVERLQKYLPIVELHHEDYDGGGYPYGLNGQSVPVGVRIVHVVDVFDAITSDRAYRKARSREDMVAIMSSESGKQFDPAVLAAFLDTLNKGKLVQAVLDAEVDGVPAPLSKLAAALDSA
jgi:HD-GYP domain-containing protein (c-di-GMP phosphodiesterase class II)